MPYVYKNPHQSNLDFYNQERARVMHERQELVNKIASLDEIIATWDTLIKAVTPLAERDPGWFIQRKGLAEICRMALEAYGQWVTAQQVRGYMAQLGVTLNYSNPMAVLHTTLGRVGQTAVGPDGNRFYAKEGLACPSGMRLI